MEELDKLREGGLKECPYCSGQATLKESPVPDAEECNFFIGCNSCGAYMGDYSEEDAISAWNDRPREAKLTAIIKELREALEFYALGKKVVVEFGSLERTRIDDAGSEQVLGTKAKQALLRAKQMEEGV